MHIGIEVADVGGAHVNIGRIGEGGVIMLPVRRGAVFDGTCKLLQRPGPDAVGRIAGNVGRIESAKVRRERFAAGQDWCAVCGGRLGRFVT